MKIPLVNQVALGAWALVLACLAIWALEMYEPDFSAEYQVGLFQNRDDLPIDGVSCVSIDARRIVFDRKEYADPKLSEDIASSLSVRDVFMERDAGKCPWELDISGISGRDYNVMLGDKFARYLVSVSVCERADSAQAKSARCLSKNIYVFNRSVSPHKLFLLGLAGLAKSQAAKEELFRIRKELL
ncbi:hypothetical protein JQ628_01055 [Bradyrhizobium lablabi]|uniref:hypothetical protein n=1 Tax=Bradyrhizobium lablabi TaxID=722472 RepID=UPI001BAAD2F7|nr:hypothetical protein [Bradyrhizobium lablabi]MBR1120083.1 hypothetical protein [Bradyrhizobium lablabi]